MISKDKDFSSSNIKSFEKSSSSNVTSTRDSNTSNFPPEEFDQKQQLQQQSFSDKREWKSSNKLSSSSSFLSNWFFNSWFFNNWLGNWLFGGFFNWWNLKQDNEQGSSMMKKKSSGSSKFSSSLFNNSWSSYFYSWFSWQQLFWLSFGGGGALFFQYMLTGFFTLFTFIGIPFSYNCFRLALHGLKPTFEIDSRNSHTMWNRLLNTVWFFSLGWMFSFTNIFFALALGIFPFTRSFAQDHLGMLELNVAPFGKIMSFASTPWRTQQAENLTNLVQEEVLIVEQEQQEKLIPKSVSRDLDGIFDKYYRDSINISIGARQEFKAWIEKRVEKKMAFLNNALMKADDNVKQIREQVEQYVLSNVRQVRDDLEAVKSELQNVQAAHKKALEDVTMLQQEADRCQSFEQRFYESQEKNMSDVSNYEKRIDQLQANISQLNNNYRKGQDEFKQLKNQYGQLENEKNKWQADYDKLLIEFNGFKLKFAEQEKFKQERDSLELELKNFKHSFAEEKKKLQNDLSKLLTKNQHLEEELKVTRSALHTSQSEREKERETMKKMKEKFDLLSNLEEECNRLEQQVERDKEERNLLEREFKQNLATMEHKFQLENKEFIKWKEERNKIQEELNELRREKVNQDQLINDKNLLQKELSAIEANYKRLQEDLLLVSKSRDETEEKNRGLVKDLKHFEKLKLSMTNTTAATTTHSTSSFAQ